MASREEEKRKRREEREAQQKAAQQAEARKRIGIVLVGLITVAAVAVVAVALLLSSGGGSDDEPSASKDAKGAAVPKQQVADFDEAVKAANCTYKSWPDEGNTHQSERFRGYKTNPPTSGTHNPEPAADGVYEAGNSPDPNNWVHTLEHGRIIFQYKPGTPANRIAQLTTLTGENVKGSPGYHMVLMENNTKMPFEVAAVAWTHSLTCKTFNEQTFDALRVFRDRFVDKGPEFVP